MSGPARPVVLSLGSNLGDRMTNLQLGVDVLASSGLTEVAVSGVYQTAPVGGVRQDDYFNAVLLAVSCLPARQILAACAVAEAAAGRVRHHPLGAADAGCRCHRLWRADQLRS